MLGTVVGMRKVPQGRQSLGFLLTIQGRVLFRPSETRGNRRNSLDDKSPVYLFHSGWVGPQGLQVRHGELSRRAECVHGLPLPSEPLL